MVYQIAEQETFELSIRVMESCGTDHCKQEGGAVCSGGVRTARASVAQLTLCITLLLFLWALKSK